MARRVKKDPDRCSEEDASAPEQNRDETLERRVLRSRYLAVKNQIVGMFNFFYSYLINFPFFQL